MGPVTSNTNVWPGLAIVGSSEKHAAVDLNLRLPGLLRNHSTYRPKLCTIILIDSKPQVATQT